MKMISMKMDKKEEKLEVAHPGESEYPYGLVLNLCSESLKKLGIEDLPEIGKKMSISAIVEVCALSQREMKDMDPDKNLSLQITDMAIEGEKKAMSKRIYGE